MKSIGEIAKCLTTGARPLHCESCGKEFNCGASLSGCWCGEIKLSDEARAELREKYRDCLCRECLEKVGKAIDQ
jgi:Cysteine-rich CWC